MHRSNFFGKKTTIRSTAFTSLCLMKSSLASICLSAKVVIPHVHRLIEYGAHPPKWPMQWYSAKICTCIMESPTNQIVLPLSKGHSSQGLRRMRSRAQTASWSLQYRNQPVKSCRSLEGQLGSNRNLHSNHSDSSGNHMPSENTSLFELGHLAKHLGGCAI